MLWDVNKMTTMHIGAVSSMCLFSTALTPSSSPDTIQVSYGLDHTFNKPGDKVDGSTLDIPLYPDVDELKETQLTMHLSSCTAWDMGGNFNDWFSRRFGFDVKLLYIGTSRRKVLGNIPPNLPSGLSMERKAILMVVLCLIIGLGVALHKLQIPWGCISLGVPLPLYLVWGEFTAACGRKQNTFNHGLTFADLAPYLIINARSWEDVQRRLPEGEAMDITKFRANIVVEGAEEPFEEDFWAEMRVCEKASLLLTQNCARCASLNVDYATGKPGIGEAGKVLKLLSKDRRVDPGTKWSPVFGRYGFLALPESPNSAKAKEVLICVGDEVKITSRNTNRTVMGMHSPHKWRILPVVLHLFLRHPGTMLL